MTQASEIEWTDATWNPSRGCSMARGSEAGGCLNCYAARLAARFPWGKGFARMTENGPRWTGRIELVPSSLEWPLRYKGHPRAKAEGRSTRIFVNSTSDLFHEALTDIEINRVFSVMARAPQHTFQVLTKRPARMLKYFEWARVSNATVKTWPLLNVCLGVSVENQETADSRIPLLLQTPAAVRFVSYEPALGPIDFRQWTLAEHGRRGIGARPGLGWLIVGGESGPGARPFNVAWARSTVAQCKAAGIPAFVKQLGARPVWKESLSYRHESPGLSVKFSGMDIDTTIALRDRKGGDMAEWPWADLRVREFPKEAV